MRDFKVPDEKSGPSHLRRQPFTLKTRITKRYNGTNN